MGFLGVTVVKNLPANEGDRRREFSPSRVGGAGGRRSPGAGNGNSLQYSYLKNPMDRGAWRATVHGVTKSRTRLSVRMHAHVHTHTHTHTHMDYIAPST